MLASLNALSYSISEFSTPQQDMLLRIRNESCVLTFLLQIQTKTILAAASRRHLRLAQPTIGAEFEFVEVSNIAKLSIDSSTEESAGTNVDSGF